MWRTPVIFLFLFGFLGLSQAIAQNGGTVEVVPTVPHAQIVNSIALNRRVPAFSSPATPMEF